MAGSAGAIRAGGAFVELLANSTNLNKGLKDAQAKVQNFGASIGSIGAKLGTIGGAITAPLLGAAKLFADNGSALEIMSQRTGVSVEQLSILGYAAKQSGTDLEGVEMALRKTAKATEAGTEENMAAIESFARLGLSVSKLAKLSPEDQFFAIAKSIESVKNPTQRAGLAMQIFGRSGESILPLIENLDKATAEAHQFGLVTSKEAAVQAHKLEQSMTLLSTATSKIVTTVGSSLAPLLVEWAEYLADLSKRAREFITANKPMIVLAFKIGAGIAAAGTALVAIGAVFASIGTIIGVFSGVLSAIAAGFALLISPIGLITAGFIGMSAYMVSTGKAGTGAFTSMKTALGGLLTEVKTTFGGMADALKAGDIMLAGKILWAGLKVEFQKGLNYLKGLWEDWGVAVLDVFTNVKFTVLGLLAEWSAKVNIVITNIAHNMNDTWTGVSHDINGAFIWVIGQVKQAWVAFANYLAEFFEVRFAEDIVNTIIKVVSEIKRQAAIAKGAITFNHEGAKKELIRINKEEEEFLGQTQETLDKHRSARAKAQQDADPAKALAENKASRDKELAANQQGREQQLSDIGTGQVGAKKVLEDAKAKEIADRRKAAQDAIASGKGDLGKAQKELENLNLEARVKAAKGMQPVGMPLGKRRPDVSGLEFDRGIQMVKGSVAGSFSGSALGGLGSGDTIQNDMLKEEKAMNSNLQAIGRKIDRAKPVWG